MTEVNMAVRRSMAKACWDKSVQGIRQFGLVSLVEEMPTVLTKLGMVGRSDKGGPTV